MLLSAGKEKGIKIKSKIAKKRGEIAFLHPRDEMQLHLLTCKLLLRLAALRRHAGLIHAFPAVSILFKAKCFISKFFFFFYSWCDEQVKCPQHGKQHILWDLESS